MTPANSPGRRRERASNCCEAMPDDFKGVSSEQIAKQFDEYTRLGALDVKWDTIRREWRVTLKSPPKQ